MPVEARYSLFPSSDQVLQSVPPKRHSARPKTPTGSNVKRQPSMRTIREEDRKDDPPAASAPVAPAIRIQVPETSSQQAGSTASARPKSATSSKSPVSFQATSPIAPPPDRPLPRAPGSSSNPKARAPALRTTSPVSSSAIQPFTAVQSSHARTKTNESASTAFTAHKQSPISPDSLTSPNTVFSPITPASETSVTYPLIPKMSSSPAPPVTGFSPPRRSNTVHSNSTARTQRTFHTSHSRAQDSHGESSSMQPPSLRRMPSVAHSRTSHTRASTEYPPEKKGFQSIFPSYNPDLPLAEQEYRPNISSAPSRPSISSRPSMDAPSTVGSASLLTEENLRALNGTPAPATAPSRTQYPPRSASVPNLLPKPSVRPSMPHADAEAPIPRLSTQQDTADLPTFDPPPGQRKTSLPSKLLSRTKPPRTKVVLAKKPKAHHKQQSASTATAQTWQTTTTAITMSDEKGCVVTKATTTLSPADDKKAAPLAVSDEKKQSRWAPTHASDVDDVGSPAADGPQHGVTVALGAMAFVMGVGVEVVGGAVGGFRRRKTKEKAEVAV